MWDSAGQTAAAAPAGDAGQAATPTVPAAATGPIAGDAQAVMAVTASAGTMSLTPVASVLAGSSVVYPVFIDPTWNSGQSNSNPSWSDVYETLDSSGDVTGYGHTWEPNNSNGGITSGVTCDPSTQDNGDCVTQHREQ